MFELAWNAQSVEKKLKPRETRGFLVVLRWKNSIALNAKNDLMSIIMETRSGMVFISVYAGIEDL